MVSEAVRFGAENRFNEALTVPNARLSTIDTAKTRIGLVLSLTLVINDPPLPTNFTLRCPLLPSFRHPLRPQDGGNGSVSFFLRPPQRSCPGLGVLFGRVGAPTQEQTHKIRTTPAAGPA